MARWKRSLVTMASALYTAEKYTYRLLWDEDRQRYLGVCTEFPDLKYEAASTNDALAGIQNRVAEEIESFTKQRKEVPEPLAIRRWGR